MTDVLWREWKKYSGCLIRGSVQMPAPSQPWLHASCAAWLCAQLEAPKFGGVQSYDGAGMSGGLLHNVAVFPGNDVDQGSLWKLMRFILNISEVRYSPDGAAFISLLATHGLLLAADGVVRNGMGRPVPAKDLRNMLTPPGGRVPKKGLAWDQASGWARMFSGVLSHQAGFDAQEQFAIGWLGDGGRREELPVYSYYAPGRVPYDAMVGIRVDSLPPVVHTAMCVYHAFSVNGPAPALTALRAAIQKLTNDQEGLSFAKTLVRRLGTSTYGRWRDEPADGGNRYDRTRKIVWANPDLFPHGEIVMPRDL